MFVKQTIMVFNIYLDLGLICWQRTDFYIRIHDIFNRDINNKMSIVNFFSNSKKIHPNDKILKVTEEKTQKS